ncbi:PIN domain-containing protein [Moorella sp. Hama-1]|uniref:type II toxin-antitoxin system VapC family toxin n=2 Tax=Moorella sp. Hama-1 TaxID=2138101 RepID=UPI000D648DE4
MNFMGAMIPMFEPVFIDTWGWIAMGYRKEPRHKEVKELYQSLRARHIPVYTSDYILDEVITLLFRRESFKEAVQFFQAILDSANQGYLSLVRITPEYFAEAWDLRRRFTDKPLISFTDLSSIVVMRDLQIMQVLTEDEHFLKVGMGFQLLP